MKKLILTFLIWLLSTSIVLAAGSVTISERAGQQKIIKYSFDWLSHTDGAVIDSDSGNPSESIGGYIVGVLFVPDSGSTQPSDLYDVYLRDANDLDWLFGTGVDLSQTASTATNFRTPMSTDGAYPFLPGTQLYLNVANAGSGKGGIVYLYIKEP